ncbi:MAG: response regulator transcription factor [Defluviitaleaceae bacterium]|nr:response regulator transcription factor [Defluviitaleaceae bacterium]
MKNILIVEDDTFINEMLCELLTQNNYNPIAAFSGTEALLRLPQGGIDLVILDLMLPGKTGEEVLQEVRAASNIPTIILTAMADKDTTVKLLRLGADDYLAKPFDNDELLARIDVQLRRAVPAAAVGSSQPNKLVFKDMVLDLEGYDAHINSTKVGLSKREFEILRLMMSHPQKVFSKNNLYESVWGDEFMGDDNIINVHISKLRAKLGVIAPGVEYVRTVWGIGFKMGE